MHPPTPISSATDGHRDSARHVVAQLQGSEIFRDYRRAFEHTTGLPLALRAPGAFHAPLQGSRRANAFCTLMAASNKTCAACLRLQQRLETEAVTTPRTLACFAGLSESAIPVRVGDRTLGYLQTGQVFLEPPSRENFHGAVREMNRWGAALDATRLEPAYFQTRVLVRRQYESIVRLVEIFSRHLASLSNQVLVSAARAELPAITRARAFIAAQHGDDISLADAARSAGMSAFYFCKVFKRVTGLTFTGYLARTRVEAVKTALMHPHARMSEAAFAAGFQSLSQFNRVFHRIVGESPSGYHAKIHQTKAGPVSVRSLPHAA